MQTAALAGEDRSLVLHENADALDGTAPGVSVIPLAGKRGKYPRHAVLRVINNAAANVDLADMQLYAGSVGLGLIEQIGTTAGTPTTLPAGESLVVDCPDFALAKAARFGGLLEVVATVTPAAGDADLTVIVEVVETEES